MAVFETASQSGSTTTPARYAIRQALDQEYQKYLQRQRAAVRQARNTAGSGLGTEADGGVDDIANANIGEDGVNLKPIVVKRDFFGRIMDVPIPMAGGHMSQSESKESQDPKLGEKANVWVSYHEGFSNAVRKPVTLVELMRGF